jgi:hypothetical protein
MPVIEQYHTDTYIKQGESQHGNRTQVRSIRSIGVRLDPTWMILLMIGLVALVLRLWSIDFQLPNIYTGFEQHEVMRAVRLGMGNFDYERTGKGGYFYLLYIEYGFFFVLLKLLGVVQSTHDFALYFMRDPSPFWLIGRCTTAVMGTASVVLTYFLGKKLFEWRVGLIAAVLLAVNPLHVKYSHYVGVDVPMVMCAIAAMYTMTCLLESGRLRAYLGTGILIGLAAMSKFPGFLLTLPFLMAHGCKMHEEDKGLVGWLDRRLLLGLLALISVYIAGNPGVIVQFSSFVNMIGPLIFAGQERDESLLHVSNGQEATLWLFYLKVLIRALGLPLFMAVLLGLVRSFWKSIPGEKCILLFSVVYYVAISMSHFEVWRDRYVMPVIPFGLILAARLLGGMMDALRQRGYNAPMVLGALVLMIVIPVGYLGVVQAGGFAKPDTRSVAKLWIETHIPPGARILMHGDPVVIMKRTVQLQNLPENLHALAQQHATDESGKATYLTMQAAAQEGKTYDLVMVQTRRVSWESLDHYRNQGIAYIVLNTREFTEQEVPKYHGQLHESRKRFYRALREDPEVRLLKRFDPEKLHANGPRLEIYKLKW